MKSLAVLALIGILASNTLFGGSLTPWINEQIEATWREQGLTPVPEADEHEFLRRAYLDLMGRNPLVEEIKAYFGDSRPPTERKANLCQALPLTRESGEFMADRISEWMHLTYSAEIAESLRKKTVSNPNWSWKQVTEELVAGPRPELMEKIRIAEKDVDARREQLRALVSIYLAQASYGERRDLLRSFARRAPRDLNPHLTFLELFECRPKEVFEEIYKLHSRRPSLQEMDPRAKARMVEGGPRLPFRRLWRLLEAPGRPKVSSVAFSSILARFLPPEPSESKQVQPRATSDEGTDGFFAFVDGAVRSEPLDIREMKEIAETAFAAFKSWEELSLTKRYESAFLATHSKNDGTSGLDAPELTSSLGESFLGVKFRCVQCHDDMLRGKRTQKEFWELARSFSFTSGGSGKGFEENYMPPATTYLSPTKGEVTVVAPAYFGESLLRKGLKRTPRAALAERVANDPRFAKAFVNQIWAHFFGTGMNYPHPVNDLYDQEVNLPQLLTGLAKEFESSGYRPVPLITAICQSRPYQLTSRSTERSPTLNDTVYFSRMAVKQLKRDVVLKNVTQLLRRPKYELNDLFVASQPGQRGRDPHSISIQDALNRLNGPMLTKVIASSDIFNRILRLKTEERRLTELFLMAYGHPPRPAQLEKFLVTTDPDQKDDEVLSDAHWQNVIWALINSREFNVTP